MLERQYKKVLSEQGCNQKKVDQSHGEGSDGWNDTPKIQKKASVNAVQTLCEQFMGRHGQVRTREDADKVALCITGVPANTEELANLFLKTQSSEMMADVPAFWICKPLFSEVLPWQESEA